MKIVLLNLPWNKLGKIGIRAGSRWPHIRNKAEAHYLPFPFFLAHAASLLKKNGFDVVLIDAIAEQMAYSKFFSLMRKIQPDFVIAETSTVTLEHDLRLLAKIKNFNKGIPFGLCGPDVNIRKKSFLLNNMIIDYVLVGEYELILLNLVTRLKDKNGVKDVLGIIYRDQGLVKVNKAQPLCELDKLPWPLREGLLMQNYNDSPGDMPLPSVQMLASRGCPYNCKFCLWPQVMYQGNNYRVRNVEDVVDEMEYLVKELNFKSIYFDDDTFNCGKQRMLSLCDKIKKRGLNVPWAIMARADLMDEEILQSMKGAGLFAVKYGIESASQKLLDGINKNMDINRTIEIVKFTKMLGIKTHLTFTFGLPGENRETIAKTIDLALKLNPTSVQFSITTPFPGTSFYNDMEKNGYILSKRWSDYDGNNKSVIYTKILSKNDLEFAVKFAYKRWETHRRQNKPLSSMNQACHPLQLFLVSFKKQGILITLYKTLGYLTRSINISISGLVGHRSKDMHKYSEKIGFKIGRLELFFNQDRLYLFWDQIRITRDLGLSSIAILGNGKIHKSSLGSRNISKISENKIIITTKYGILPIQEEWLIEALDEKQIKVEINIKAQGESEFSKFKLSLVLSERYKKWIDSWGEGYLPFNNNMNEVELRNSNTTFVGVRGRKRFKGQLPTVLFCNFGESEKKCFFVKNSGAYLGAREIGVESRNGAFKLTGSETLFLGRIKIVEEDFKKNNKKNK